MKLMWEILVPTVRNDGRPIKTRFHRVWDQKVYAITGGLTIMPPTHGRWVSPSGKLFAERMIPVKIMATRAEMGRIVHMTAEYYEQEAVLAYVVSNEVLLHYRDEKAEMRAALEEAIRNDPKQRAVQSPQSQS